MISKIIDNQKKLEILYYKKLDKLRETFDFNNPKPTFQQMEEYASLLKTEIIKHFEIQQTLNNKINNDVNKLILENRLVQDILIRMCNKIIDSAKKEDINIFPFFDDFEEILKAYLAKEKGLFIQELNNVTTNEEKIQIQKILD